jgi:hypothetical protein
MPHPAIHEFGKALIRHVRDEAIRACDQDLLPTARSRQALRWRESAAGTGRPAPEMLVADCVDRALAQLMFAVDLGTIRILVPDGNGGQIDLTEEGLGELCGWYMGVDGWRGWHSKERLFDDVADLAANPTKPIG